MKRNSDEEIEKILRDICVQPSAQEMKRYVQHGKISTYDHCRNVAEFSCRMDKTLHLHADRNTLVKGAMLHDLFLYDWHDGSHRLHGFTHAEEAAGNAERIFGVDRATRHVISSHMWPLNLTQIPRSREAWIVCCADKMVSLYETIFER